jgi:hypothetical protein
MLNDAHILGELSYICYYTTSMFCHNI